MVMEIRMKGWQKKLAKSKKLQEYISQEFKIPVSTVQRLTREVARAHPYVEERIVKAVINWPEKSNDKS